MTRLALSASALLLAGISITGASRAPRPGVDWPQFRGIAATGIGEGFPSPATWSVADGTNVVWKTPIPVGL